jgi:hypothetical protein
MQEPQPQQEASGNRRGARKLLRRPRVRLGAALALAVGAGLLAWAVVDSRGTGSSTSGAATTAQPIGPIALSAKGLRTLTQTVDQPIYWAGPKAGYLYELTRTSTGKVFIRYLPQGAKVGSKKTIYLIVATYPFQNPLQALKNLTNRHLRAIPGGGVAMVDQNHPQSVHLAYPGVDDQVEVYDPSPAQALQVAQSGKVRPVTPRS